MAMTVREYAQGAGVSPRRIRAMIEAGSLTAEKRAGAWWITEELPLVQKGEKAGPRLSLESFDRLASYLDGFAETLTPEQRRTCKRQAGRMFKDGLPAALSYADRRGLRVRHYSAKQKNVEMLRKEKQLLLTGVSHEQSGIASGVLDGYVPAERQEFFQALYGLQPEGVSRANVTLRFVDYLPERVCRLHVLTDLAQDPSSRSVDAAKAMLKELKGEFYGVRGQAIY